MASVAKQQLNLNVFYPALFQAFEANIALGKDPLEFLKQFQVDKPKGGFKKGDKQGLIKMGGTWYDVAGLSAAVPDLLQQQQAAQADQFQKSYDTLSAVPALQGIFDEASGQFSPQFTADINAGYEAFGGALLGQGAQSGFLADPNKQASILGPLALDKAMFLKNLQKSSEAQALGLAGVGGLTSPVGATGAGTAQSYLPGIFNVASMQQGQSQFMSNQGFLEKQSNQQGYGALLGAGLGAYGTYAGLAALCWVADELWGADDPRAHAARLWASTHDSPFLRLYRVHGKAWAAWLHENAWAKPLVEPIWMAMAVRGAQQMAAG